MVAGQGREGERGIMDAGGPARANMLSWLMGLLRQLHSQIFEEYSLKRIAHVGCKPVRVAEGNSLTQIYKKTPLCPSF